MKALISFLDSYNPLYSQIVKGYPPDAIARLEQALRRPLPAAYRDFLETAAANVGFPHDDVCFELEEIIELAITKRDRMPSTFTPIAVDLSPSHSDRVHLAASEARTVNIVAETICDNMPGQAVRRNY